MEDILETGLGVEIVDEYDRVADLRVLASELRDRRLLQLQGSKLRRSDGEEAAG